LSGNLKGREYLENLAVDEKIKGWGGPTYPSLSSFQAERKMGMYYVNICSKQT
jgi:hypothetical protein